MIRKVKEEVTLIGAYQVFNMEKIAQGMGDAKSQNYWDCIKPFLDFAGADLNKKPDITQQMVSEWTINMLKTLSPNSVNHYVRGLRVFLYWLMRNKYIAEFKVKLVKAQEPKIKFIPDEELKLLLKKPPKNASFYECRAYTIVCFLLATGCRASTLINIKLEDIDFANRVITYQHSKNKALNTVPMSSALNKALKDFLTEWKRDKPEGYLFCNVGEDQMTVNALKLALARYCKSRGTAVHYPHSFRHSFARQWVLNGGNAFSLQHMLNHSDLDVTKRYVRIFGDDLKADIEEYSALDKLTESTRRTLKIRRA